MSEVPNPGSPEAVEAGCTCPVLDNARGRGYMGVDGTFIFTSNCPVHCWPDIPDDKLETEVD